MLPSEVAAHLAPLAAIFNREISPELAQAYAAAMPEVQPDELRRAVMDIARTEKFFPTPAAILERLGSTRKERGLRA